MAVDLFSIDLAFVFKATAIGCVTWITYYITKMYYSRRNYPPGPVPLPFVGNLLMLRYEGKNKKRHLHEIFIDLSQKYGPFYTFWFGPIPQIVVIKPNYVREVFTKAAFAGRINFGILPELFFGKGNIDVAFGDFSREWEVLRKVTHSAIRKLTISPAVPPLVAKTMVDITEEIRRREGFNSPFSPTDYLTIMVYSVLAKLAFGVDFTLDHPDFLKLKQSSQVQKQATGELTVIIFMPILRFLYWKKWKKVVNAIDDLRNYHLTQMKLHIEEFKKSGGVVNDFAGAMLAAKQEAEAEDSNDAVYLHEGNLGNAVMDLLFAGSDTTSMTLTWIFLIIANDPDGLQAQLRKEVEEQIGDELPTLEHRASCHLINSFITETLRFRPVTGVTIPHKTVTQTELGSYGIPKGTAVMASILSCNRDPELFSEPEKFKPDRFISPDGTFSAKSIETSITFGGTGRRSCPGNKLATTNIFYIVAGWFQNTKDCKLVLENGPGSSDLAIDNSYRGGLLPMPYKMKLVPLNS